MATVTATPTVEVPTAGGEKPAPAPAEPKKLVVTLDQVLREPLEALAVKQSTSVSGYVNKLVAAELKIVLPERQVRVRGGKVATPAFSSLAGVTDTKAKAVGSKAGKLALTRAALERMNAAVAGGEQWALDILAAANQAAEKAAAAANAAEAEKTPDGGEKAA